MTEPEEGAALTTAQSLFSETLQHVS